MRFHTVSRSLSAVALLSATAAVAQAQGRSWSGTVGTGAVAAPKYAGGEDYRTIPIPYIQLQYRDRITLGVLPSGLGAGIGANLVRSQSFTWDAALSGVGGRRERYGAALAGMGDQKGTGTAATSVAYSTGHLTTGASVAAGLAEGSGVTGTVNAGIQRQLFSRWLAGVSAAATFADADNMAYDFGVTDEQAARRRSLIGRNDARLRSGDDRAFRPGSGLKQTVSSASLGYALSDRTRLMAFAQTTWLSDEAARSSIVRDRTSTSGGAMIVYGF